MICMWRTEQSEGDASKFFGMKSSFRLRLFISQSHSTTMNLKQEMMGLLTKISVKLSPICLSLLFVPSNDIILESIDRERHR